MQLTQVELDQFIEQFEEYGLEDRAHQILSKFKDLSPEEAEEYRGQFDDIVNGLLEKAKMHVDDLSDLPENLEETLRQFIAVAINRRAAGYPASPWADD